MYFLKCDAISSAISAAFAVGKKPVYGASRVQIYVLKYRDVWVSIGDLSRWRRSQKKNKDLHCAPSRSAAAFAHLKEIEIPSTVAHAQNYMHSIEKSSLFSLSRANYAATTRREFFCAGECAAPGWAKKYTLNCTFANRVNEFAREDKLLGATFQD